MENKRAEKVTVEQKEILVDFMSDHIEFSRGKLLGPEGKIISGNLWQILCQQLDAVGSKKNIAQWQRVWKDIKMHAKKKIATMGGMRIKTGGGPSEDLNITDMEEKILNIISKTAIFGVDGPDGVPLDSAEPMQAQTEIETPVPMPSTSKGSSQTWVSFAERDVQQQENLCTETFEILSPAYNPTLSSDDDTSATPQKKRKRQSESAQAAEDFKDLGRETVQAINEVKDELKNLTEKMNIQNQLHKNTNDVLLRIALALEGQEIK